MGKLFKISDVMWKMQMMKIAQNSFCRLMFHHFSITVSPLAQCHGIVVAPWTSYQLVFLPNKWYTIGKLLYHVHIAFCTLCLSIYAHCQEWCLSSVPHPIMKLLLIVHMVFNQHFNHHLRFLNHIPYLSRRKLSDHPHRMSFHPCRRPVHW